MLTLIIGVGIGIGVAVRIKSGRHSQVGRCPVFSILIPTKAENSSAIAQIFLVFYDRVSRVSHGSLKWGCNMKTVQITVDKELVQEVDQITQQLRTSRSAFTRKALQEALDRYKRELLEQKHIQGYEKHPVSAEEFPGWEEEQVWVD